MRRPKPIGHTEYHIKQEVKRILDETGWIYWMPSANAFGRGGQSDFLAVKAPKLFVAIETKYKDVPTQLQLEFLKMIHEAGHYAFLVDETNVEVLRELLMDEIGVDELQNLLNETEYKSLMKWQENLTNTQ